MRKLFVLTIAATTCFLLAEGQAGGETRQDETHLGIKGRLMPLHIYATPIALQEGTEDSEDATAGMSSPLVLVVESEGETDDTAGAPNTSTDTSSSTATRNPATSEERAYVLIFENEEVEDKALQILRIMPIDRDEATKDGRDVVSQSNEGEKEVRIQGEREIRGGIRALYVEKILESGPDRPSGLSVVPNPPSGLRVVPNPPSGLRVVPNPPSGLRVVPNER